MYEPYPGGSSAPGPSRREPPPSVVKAVRAMQVGMAASLVGIVINLASVGSLKSDIQRQAPHLTASQVTQLERFSIGEFIAAGLIGAALWLWMAQSCRAGKSWARIVSTVLFGIYTVGQIAAAAIPSGGAGRLYNIVLWLIGLVAIVFLWQRSSTEYFRDAGRVY